MYLAIIGDLVRSKQLSASDRRTLQNKLKDVLKRINQNFAEEVASEFLITLGDEFQGLLKRPDQVLVIIETIQSAVAGHPVRFGLGMGAIFTPIETKAIGADGPAYHLARQALDTLKLMARRSEQASSAIRLELGSGNTDLINSLFAQLYHQESGWTMKQQAIVWGMRHVESQKDLAKQLKVSQPYINQVLQSTGYYTYRASQQAVTEAMKELFYD